MDSLLQVHNHFVIQLKDHPYEFPVLYPFCTFDYRTFCDRLLAQADVEILRASVLGHEGRRVYTTKGVFESEILIDATGWRAELATNANQRTKPHYGKSFGLETVIPVEKQGLHFYYDKPSMGAYNVGWVFPTGASSRAGFGSYRGVTRLNAALDDFVRDYFECSSDHIHGGYWPYLTQPAVSENVFRVGDSAGQCIPLTGEGIRPAMYFGAMAGNLARRVLDGELRLSDALLTYQRANKPRRRYYLLLATQKIAPGLPMKALHQFAKIILRSESVNAVMRAYWEWMDPNKMADMWRGRLAGPGASSLTQPGVQSVLDD